MDSLVRSSTFSGFGQLVRDLGGDPAELLQHFGFPQTVESDTDRYVPFSKAVALLEHSATSLGCPNFGLRLSTRQGLAILGPVAVLARNSKTVASALEALGQYIHLVSPAIKVRSESRLAEQCLRIYLDIDSPSVLRSRQFYELVMGNGQLITRMLIGAEEFAQKIYFPYTSLASDHAYTEFFGCEVVFGQDFCAVDLPLSLAQHEVVGADAETARVAAEYLAEHFEAQTITVPEKVLQLIHRLLPTGFCNMPVVAEQLHLHPKTLQRRLAEHDRVFEQMVDQVRQELAYRYLCQPELRFTQIAGLLGYSDQSALNRSCKRWFGKTPGQLRQSGRESQAPAHLAGELAELH